jgi:hypothetical protein
MLRGVTPPPAPTPDTPTPDTLTPRPASPAAVPTRRAWRIPRAGSLARRARVDEPLPPPASIPSRTHHDALNHDENALRSLPTFSFVFLLPSRQAANAVATGLPHHSHATRDCIWQALAGTAELAVDWIAPDSVAAFGLVGACS